MNPAIKLLTNANVYSPTHLGLKDVLVAANKIVDIFDCGQAKNLPKNWQVEITDINQDILIPGMIDCHAHITGGGGETGFSSQVPPVALSEFTHAGITTVVGLLGTDDTTRSTENLVSKAYGLREEGLSAYCWTGGYHYPLTTITGNAKKDIVFIEPIIGIGEFALSDHRSSQASYDEVIRLASESYVAGLMTGKAGVIHFHMGDGERRLELIEQALDNSEIPARVFHPTHVNRNTALFEDSCKLLNRGCYIDITAFPNGTAEPGIEAYQAIQMILDKQYPLSQVTLSSDGGGCLPCFNKQGELLHMDFGRSETILETIKLALLNGNDLATLLPLVSSNVAASLKLRHKGEIAKNKDADIVVLDDKYSVKSVMALGKWHKKDGKILLKGMFE